MRFWFKKKKNVGFQFPRKYLILIKNDNFFFTGTHIRVSDPPPKKKKCHNSILFLLIIFGYKKKKCLFFHRGMFINIHTSMCFFDSKTKKYRLPFPRKKYLILIKNILFLQECIICIFWFKTKKCGTSLVSFPLFDFQKKRYFFFYKRMYMGFWFKKKICPTSFPQTSPFFSKEIVMFI